jgi:hypothetical protein
METLIPLIRQTYNDLSDFYNKIPEFKLNRDCYGWFKPDDKIKSRYKSYLPCIICLKDICYENISVCYVFPYDNQNKNVCVVCKNCYCKIDFKPPSSYEQYVVLSKYYNKKYETFLKIYNMVNQDTERLYNITYKLLKWRQNLTRNIERINVDICDAENQYNMKKEKLENQKNNNEILDELIKNEEKIEDEIKEKRGDIRREVIKEIRSVGDVVNKYIQDLTREAIKSLPDPEEEKICLPYCSICKIKKIDTAINCGHIYCQGCISNISTCPYCRHYIYTKTKLYFN